MDWLLFTYRAPMASFGEVAGYTRRPSLSAPTRSGVLGMIAACLGVIRSDETRLQAIEGAYGVAVRSDAGGSTLWDFHTAQVSKGAAAWGSETRAHELRAGELATMISHREYVCDGCYTVAIWCRVTDPPHALNDIARALNEPVFTPFAGRASCLFSVPFNPVVLNTETLADAMARREPLPAEIAQSIGFAATERSEVLADLGCLLGVPVRQIVVRHDRRMGPRAFGRRQMALATLTNEVNR
jgi:CRISPR system Cascade subunit CasD